MDNAHQHRTPPGEATVRVIVGCHARRVPQQPRSEEHDHQGHGEFEKVCEAFRDCYTKGDHEKAGDEQGNRVSRAPQSADDSRLP